MKLLVLNYQLVLKKCIIIIIIIIDSCCVYYLAIFFVVYFLGLMTQCHERSHQTIL